MAKDRLRKCEKRDGVSHRNPNLLAHYHDCASRLFYNGGRANECLHNFFLKAAKNGEIERVKNFLLRSSRNNNVNIDYKDKTTGNTAIFAAVQGNHKEIVKLLLNYGADITLQNNEGQSVVELASETMRQTLLASVERQGISHRHLLQAAWQGNMDILKRLLSSQADLNVNCKNADGMTPLLLVTRDINLFEKIEKVVAENGYQPVEVMRELLLHKADSNMVGIDGKSALHYIACNKGRTAEEMANLIINNKNSCLEVPDQLHCPPIHFACREDNGPVLLALINGGVNVNARGTNGQTPLHMAAAHGYEGISSTLLDNGADVTLVDNHGNSPVDVTTSKKVHHILREAWSKQTNGKVLVKTRSFSAPIQHNSLIVEETEVVVEPTAIVEATSPRKQSPPPTQNSIIIDNGPVPCPPPKKHSPVARSKSLTTKSSFLVQSPQKNSSQQPGSRSQTRQISSRSQQTAIFTQNRLELPRLSVKNIELQFSSSPRPDFSSYYYNNIQRVRLLTQGQSRSFPTTPDISGPYRNGTNKEIPTDGSLPNTKKVRIPTRVAPLTGRRPVTPELALSQSSLRSGSSLENTGQVIDLDVLQNNSNCLPSLAKLIFSTDECDTGTLLQPPSSPVDSDETAGINGLEDQYNENIKPMTAPQGLHSTACGKSVTSNECEHHYEEENDKVDETKNEMLTMKLNKSDQFDTSAIYQTQTFSPSLLSEFWIPNMKDNEKVDTLNELVSEGQENGKETRESEKQRERSESTSVSFFVDLNDINDHAQCCSCNNQLDTKESRMCTTCVRNNRPVSKTFWISMDGQTSDREADTSSAEKTVQNVHQRKAKSLPATLQPSGPFHMEKSSDHREKEKIKRESEDLELHSEGTFIIEPKPKEETAQNNILETSVQNEQNPNQGINSLDSSTQKDSTDAIVLEKQHTSEDFTNNEATIVLQSINAEDYELPSTDETPSNQTESTEIENTIETPSNTDTKSIQNENNSQPGKPVEGPKSAWSSGVQICNAFPSPVPPKNPKPQVQPPIGENIAKTRPKKPSGKKSKTNNITESKKKTRDKSKNANGKEQVKKGKKGKSKKKDQCFKEITVNQSGADMARVLESGPESRDISVGGTSPDVDHALTLSIDSKTLSCKMLKRNLPVLSPIPECSPSSASTPRSFDVSSRVPENNLQKSSQETGLVAMGESKSSGNCTSDVEPAETRTTSEGGIELNGKTVCNLEDGTVEGEKGENNIMDGHGTQQDQRNNDFDHGYDEVDGGILSHMLRMCIPRLNKSNSDSEEEMIKENADADDITTDEDDSNADDDDNACAIRANQNQPVASHEARCLSPEGEINQDIEDMFQEILQNSNDVFNPSFNNACHLSEGGNLNDEPASLNEGKPCTVGAPLEVGVTHKKKSKKSLKHKRTMDYVSQMHHLTQKEMDEFDEVFFPTEKSDPFINEDGASSDNDSSYISCESTSRCVSDCSTFESSDSVLKSSSLSSASSRDESRAMTPDNGTLCASVDIKAHERIYQSSNTSSSDSRSTLSNNSVVSAQSFMPSSGRVLRSQVSAGSFSSVTSCGGDIQWQKGNILGKGGFGTVWLGLVSTTGEMIAVKQVELNQNDDEAEKQYEKLQEEVSLLRSLRHENIVKYIGTCLDENFVVNIFMEFVPGGSIAQALKRFGAFVEPVFQRYTKQIVSGVKYLHNNNVIHRDIKGGNIMLMPNGVIKLIDFGCAKRLCRNLSLSRSSMLHSLKGTPYWMAPEVIKETGHGTKSDIWSIGCTVYEMAMGTPPWSEMPPMTAIFSIGSGSNIPQLGESFSQLARDFTSACLTRDPEARPSASELLKHEFLLSVQ